ncbi:Spo0E family sporulation regulatory protein-aspartic acid phosphatase [Oceanobacillus sp. AG]|uniref:Spo0E family sporulation regulatory protein-aspartic acid phosphatase n=1 Tax=Oceanobacillus sp. AG TaxID=2681969 RepID=UPI00351A1096
MCVYSRSGIGVKKALGSKTELSKEIEVLKIKMIRISEEKGMNNPLTIQISQELDKLINEYMRLTQKK